MRTLFADTFYFVALVSPRDTAHRIVETISLPRPVRIVTSTWVLTEVANSLSKRTTRGSFSQLYRGLRNDADVDIVDPEASLFEEGVQLYAARPDKDWSLTDCISFVIMEQRGVADALTADHHFEQAGFNALFATD